MRGVAWLSWLGKRSGASAALHVAASLSSAGSHIGAGRFSSEAVSNQSIDKPCLDNVPAQQGQQDQRGIARKMTSRHRRDDLTPFNGFGCIEIPWRVRPICRRGPTIHDHQLRY